MTRWLFLSIAVTVLAFAGSGYVYLFHYDRLPDPMPTHWNVEGEPDQWTPRALGFRLNFLLVPAVMAGMVLLTPALPWLSPKSFDLDRFRTTYEYIMFLVVALFGVIHLAIAVTLLDPEQSRNRLFVGGFMLFFALIGNVMGQVRRNFYVGVRTPWTLASETVWNQTHRLSAWLFVAFGVLGFFVVMLVPGTEVMIGCFVTLLVVALIPVAYSLILYKRLEKLGKL